MKVTGKKVLIAGGAGFIGSHLVDVLAPLNKVTVVDNLSNDSWNNIREHVERGTIEFIKADIRDEERMTEVVKGKEVIFNLAVQCLRISIEDPLLVHEVNATGSLNLCMAAMKNGIERFVYISSSEVYGTAKKVPMDEEHPLEPTTPYGASKLAGEAYVRAYHRTFGLPVVVVRPFNTYGPREHMGGPYGEVIPRFVVRCLNGLPPVIFGDGEQTRDFTEVTDTARGIVEASECDSLVGETVNIGAGHEVSINEIARIISELLGMDMPPAHLAPRPGDVRRHLADISKAHQLFNFSPQTTIVKGIEHYIGWLKNQDLELDHLQREAVLLNWIKEPKRSYVGI